VFVVWYNNAARGLRKASNILLEAERSHPRENEHSLDLRGQESVARRVSIQHTSSHAKVTLDWMSRDPIERQLKTRLYTVSWSMAL
jgi:hypothetical protein